MYIYIIYILYIHILQPLDPLFSVVFYMSWLPSFRHLDPDLERFVGNMMSSPMKGGGKGPFDAQVVRERIAI